MVQVVIRTMEDFDVLHWVVSERVLWHHSLNSVIENSVWVLREQIFEGIFLESTWITSMMSIDFLLPLSTRHVRITHVYDDAFVGIFIPFWIVTWLILSTNNL